MRRNYVLKHVTERKIEGRLGLKVTRRQGRRRKKLLDELRAKNGCWKLNDGALDRTL